MMIRVTSYTNWIMLTDYEPMKQKFEKIEPGFGSSFSMRRFSEEDLCNAPSWHFHPEYELVFISEGNGKRHVGNHISYFEDGDLLLLGPNIPHFGFSDEIKGPYQEVVVQMGARFLGDGLLQRPEFKDIRQLLEGANQGYRFFGSTFGKVGNWLDLIWEKQPFDRLIELLRLLQFLAETEERETLGLEGMGIEVSPQDFARIDLIYQFVEQHYQRSIPLDEIAKQVSMTVPAFCRYFKRLTNKTFTNFVNEYRIAAACQLLANPANSISNIAFECGFNNLSHFNSQFRQVTNLSPSGYRKQMKKLL